ncbi:MAG: D-glycero-beta-D-manno-heptose 1-phosphate adenylyltransferase [Cyanobacteria bacterium REEB67]|nr:D-glycero-beta-D-manno-heptose 1-phosphate adenylyltransferase [Cyanobacteria bacterium REEB67]
MGQVVNSKALAEAAETARKEGKCVVTTNGCFDILHVGHVRILNQARAEGDLLFLGLNSDASVKRLKGADRPINNENDRAELLANLLSVDYVFIFEEDTPIEFLKLVKPDIHIKGADYTTGALAETPVVESFGGVVKLMPLVPLKSTTSLVEKIKQGC